MLDLVIRGAELIDGSGAPRRRGDVAVRDGRIVVVGETSGEGAAATLDANGLCLAPGFIDIHTHSDLQPFAASPELAKLRQGVTTEIAGNCGLSMAPLSERARPMVRDMMQALAGQGDVPLDWDGMDAYLARLAAAGPLVNMGTHVGHTTLRATVCGMDDRPPTAAEMERMKAEVAAAFAAGAFGLSSGLIYPPGSYADTAELVALAAVSKGARPYVTHLRHEGVGVIAAAREALAIGEAARCPVHISHLKTADEAAWPRQDELLGLIRAARAAGRDVTFDQYPYCAGSTALTTLLPGWAHAGGGDRLLARLREPSVRARLLAELRRPPYVGCWDKVVVSAVTTENNRAIEGLSLEAIAAHCGVEPAAALLDICVEEQGRAAMVQFSMSEENVRAILREPEGGMVGSDGIYGGRPHPRAYGTFARVLGRYVREEGVLGLEEAVMKMTGRPAARLGLADRGRLAPGAWADLVLFDPQTVIDRATFQEPTLPPAGIPHVFVNGVAAIRDGRPTGASAGRVLRARTGTAEVRP